MITVVDQIGQSHTFKSTPERIVSLVPSQTELLVDLGLIDAIQGITKFCVHPEDLRQQKTVVGGTKQVSIEKIKALAPDIILCNKEENTKEMVEELSALAPVHVSDVKTLDDTYQLIKQYGILFDVNEKAAKILTEITESAKNFKNSALKSSVKSCLYLIWKNPYMAAGQDTFINHLLELNGFKNVIKGDRYPEVQIENLPELQYVFLSSEPYPFQKKHIEEIERHTKAQVILVDGEFFSWYGSRVLGAFSYFKQLQSQLEL